MLSLKSEHCHYGVVAEGLLTFLGSLYKKVALSLRETNRQKKSFFLPKTLCPQLRI